jgi:eukaryotic-like serine/threonine-protein kinase
MLHSKQFGRYEILSKLGRGMTDVYLAMDSAQNRRTVLKIVEQSADPWTQIVLEAERRGSEIQKQLHEVDPRFLEVYDSGDRSGCYFIAMQYIEGRSLAEILQAEKRIAPARAAEYAAEVASQLEKLHSFQIEIDGRKRAVVHGDIKPANIQICPSGEVRLLDFGISKAITFTHHLTYHNLGSPGYCSPERLRRAQVDPHSDLWALGATLYEMVAGFPPYQAQSTQKLEELIRSKRPPRALPDDCPAPLKAVIRKTLAGEIENRYPTAAAMEQDLRAFITDRPTQAGSEKQRAWTVNPTVEKDRTSPRTPLKSVPEVVVRLRAALPYLKKTWVPISAVAVGLLIGALLYIEMAFAYRFWADSKPLRGHRDYTHSSVAQIDADWNLYKQLRERNLPLGPYSPVGWLTAPLREGLLAAADDVIERYRDSSDPSPNDFDWQRARVCLKHALELDGSDASARGKLALCNGYITLQTKPQTNQTVTQAKASFGEAAYNLPRSPDPHLGLARLYVYNLRNVGRAVAEVSVAERLGFKAGPREAEEQADGYLYRAEQELLQADRAKPGSPEAVKYATRTQSDLQRAANLYEPIEGFSSVGSNLERLDLDRAKLQSLQARKELASNPRKRYGRRR